MKKKESSSRNNTCTNLYKVQTFHNCLLSRKRITLIRESSNVVYTRTSPRWQPFPCWRKLRSRRARARIKCLYPSSIFVFFFFSYTVTHENIQTRVHMVIHCVHYIQHFKIYISIVTWFDYHDYIGKVLHIWKCIEKLQDTYHIALNSQLSFVLISLNIYW